jgi:hypothetical protein
MHLCRMHRGSPYQPHRAGGKSRTSRARENALLEIFYTPNSLTMYFYSLCQLVLTHQQYVFQFGTAVPKFIFILSSKTIDIFSQLCYPCSTLAIPSSLSTNMPALSDLLTPAQQVLLARVRASLRDAGERECSNLERDYPSTPERSEAVIQPTPVQLSLDLDNPGGRYVL